ncbi:TonB-linked SusC/RagA family outer membrane protein [Lewinella aquimaris]|uniref:TonB-linked SusC/RagA family outer membrane protein n=1 Tax=Neolewinella aquimaris TaxID=1835722 RepID=A0A840EF30_9BACT|nr:TonB-dependent receptor [Neolewinella aquimaris]MBB4079546.1 TonB-linked SusC/RagA family outer membrane protein [Neolewinella aquimaris]
MLRLLYFSFVLLLSLTLSAQTTVTGTVTDGSETLIGVSIQAVGTTTGTVTDFDGTYTLTVPAGTDSLIYSYTGFQTQRVAIAGRTVIDITLAESTELLEEVVVIGYGVQQKDDLTGAVSVVESSELTDIPTQSLGQSLQGKVSGLQIIPGSGAPGADAIFRIRGVGTLNNADPLFVVDGMILSDISFLNPQDVQSISVLKDASATAIYGARGANGVIIVSTKQGGGAAGAGGFTVSAYTGTQEVIRTIDVLNANQYATLLNEVDVNEGRQPRFANPEQYGEGTNWQDEVFRTAPIYNAQLSFNGGGDRGTFNFSANYFRQDGIIEGSNFDRFTIRLNNSRQVKNWLNVGSNLSLGINGSDNVNAGSIITTAYRADPITVPIDSAGNFGDATAIGNTGNPLATIFYSNNRSQSYRAVGNAYADISFLDHFTFRTNFGLDFDYNRNRNFSPVFFVSANQQNEESSINVFNGYNRNWLWENTVSYNNNFGIHHLDGVAGVTYQDNFGEFLNGGRQRLIGDDPSFFYLNSGDVTTATNGGGAGSNWGLVSYLGRLNYTFDSRYLITVSGRLDGSSRFGDNYKYGFFPSVGLGWNISREDFFNADGIISRLKLRASWGQTGNDRIGDFDYLPRVVSGVGAVFGNDPVLVPGSTLTTLANPDLRWEETTQTDIGVELGLFDNKFLLEADFYRKVTNDILFNAPIPDYIGANAPLRNVASVLNRGVDLNVSWRETRSDFQYSIGGNASFVHNEVLKLDGTAVDFFNGGLGIGGQLGTNSRVGFAAGSFYGYELDGVFQNEEELATFPKFGNQQVGDLRFRDQNGDGVITAAEDRVILGSAIPDMILGVNGSANYRGIELSFDLTGQFGNEVINAKKMARFGAYNYETSFLDRWNGEGTSNSEPRITQAGQNIETLSTRFVEDGSYLRLRNVTLGYRFASGVTEKLRAQSLRIYVSGTNLVTSQKYSGYNPEIYNGSVFDNGIDRGSIYPIARTLTAGIDVTF